jgi:nitrous oxidase accessory protein NosD
MKSIECNLGATILTLVVLVVSSNSQAAVRHVPAEYPTIQVAVNAASIGDTILVAPGTYFENVVINRRVALISVAGAELTTIDGRDLGTVVLVQKQVDHAVIEGFRVTHGRAISHAGGISVEIDFVTGGYATIRRNIVEHNYSEGGPGGIYSVRQSIVEDNIIQNNNEEISKGIGAMEVSGTIERNIIRNNRFGLQTIRVYNTNTFAWNLIVDDWPGLIARFGNGGSIHNNTFVAANSIAQWTVDLRGPISYDFRNNLIVHGEAGGLNCSLTGSHSVSCNDVWGEGQSYMGDCGSLEGINGNFSDDPLFCDAQNGDFRLSPGSPCALVPGCGLVGALDMGCGVLGVDSGGAVPLRPRLVLAPNPVWLSSGASLIGMNHGDLIEIYDLSGRVVDIVGPTLSTPFLWHPHRDLPSGVYFARIRGSGTGSTRFVLVR